MKEKRRSQFFNRMFRLYFFSLAVVITAAMFLFYFASVEHIKSNTYDNSHRLAQKTARQVDAYLSEFDLLAEQVTRHKDILTIFYRLAEEENAPDNYFRSDVLTAIDISMALKNLLPVQGKNHSIVIYNNKGDVISDKEYARGEEAYRENVTDLSYAQLLNQLDSEGTIVRFPAENTWNNSERKYITLIKPLKNSYSDNICGVIEVSGSAEELFDSISSEWGSDYTVFICDRGTGKCFPKKPDNKNARCINYPIKNANWEIAVSYKEAVNTDFKAELILVITAVYALLLIVLYKLTKLIGMRISKPLTELTDHVRAVNAPEDQIPSVDRTAIDEIKELEQSFGKMLERVDHSMKQEKKAYSLALQAQMTPHFLYNTLAVISAAGEENGNKKVTLMCDKLSDMLRYVTAYQKVTVSLKEEIIHTENYLALMKARYEEYFSYRIEVSDSLLNLSVPKLFIQPLAENCFKHGFKDKEPPWHIEIKMTAEGCGWRLMISDNGTGISEEKIREIRAKTDRAALEGAGAESGGLGIANTIIRLKMTHDEGIDYTIFNREGMVICITSGKREGEADV